MNHNILLRATVTGILPAAGLLNPCIAQEEVGKPNIIYILADDLGLAELGCFGQE